MRKDISRIVPLFMELLLSALWQRKANPLLFEHIDADLWKNILKYAKFQRVIALVYDGVQTLPDSLKPPQDLLILQAVQTEAIERRNEYLNRSLAELAKIYKEMDCSFLLLKGQGLALHYPNPSHRTPGDIDVYLYKENDYVHSKQWVEELEVKMDIEGPKHIGFYWKDVRIENHSKAAILNNYFHNRRFQQYISSAVENAEVCRIGEADVRVLSPEANAIFLFIHLFIHFTDGGVGIRQLCDWVLFLQANHQQIDAATCTRQLKRFGLLRPARIFARELVDTMEAPEEIFPFPVGNTTKNRKVMEDVWEGGHFGFQRIGLEPRPKGRWSGRWHSLMQQCCRSFNLYEISPDYFLESIGKRVWVRFVLTITGKG